MKLIELEATLHDQHIEHEQLLGAFFLGAETDWTATRQALDWTTQLYRQLVGGPITPEMRRVALGAPRQVKALQQRYERFAPIWEEWRDIAAFLETFVDFGVLYGDDVLLDDIAVEEIMPALARLSGALDTFWHALDQIAEHRTPGHPLGTLNGAKGEWSRLCDDLASAQRVRELREWFTERDADLRAAFGATVNGIATDWDRLRGKLDWSERFLAGYADATLPAALTILVSAEGDQAPRERLSVLVQAAHEAADRVEEELRFSDTIMPRDALTPSGTPYSTTPLREVQHHVELLIEHVPDLERWLACLQSLDRCRALGLGDAVDALLREQPFPRDAVDCVEKRFYTLWLDQVWKRSDILATFRGVAHEQVIARFRELDEAHADLARLRLRARLADERRLAIANAPIGSEMQELKRLVQLKRHKSIRHIVLTTGRALLRTKPCWMMSPMSASQYIDEVNLFDTVIFDEASQVCVEDAVCAILRGKQLIVVGDAKQLPPTRFFAKSLADEDEDDDNAAPSNERVESILDECVGKLSERSLKWHYRSQHESLIAFSNQHFYKGDLITFPSPRDDQDAGVRFVYVANGRYDRGGKHNNPPEAERVVDLVFEQVERDSTVSLGVVALSSAQEEAIDNALENRLRRLPDGHPWKKLLGRDDPAGFFIKNLESVQGDERDVIIMSVGYGPDASGRVFTNFGPVNRSGGERRLNVAITRARTQFILVSSMRAEDLPNNMGSPGARKLRDYLDYAERGQDALNEQSRSTSSGMEIQQFDSPFEEAVYAALTARGLTLATQVGCSGYRIDLAVRDVSHPGRYLLGIECDGRTYHSSATARDRDRLRQRHLETMGWRIHRIWSSDWVTDPAGEIAKVLDAVTGQLPLTLPLTSKVVNVRPTGSVPAPKDK